MPPEGMVHALKLVHGLLEPGGELVDLHPLGVTPVFEVCTPGGCIPAGVLLESDHHIEYLQAAAALLRSAAMGWYQRKAQAEFIFRIKTKVPGELFDYLWAKWSDAANLAEAAEQVQRVFTTEPQALEVHLVEPIRISRYLRL